MDLIERIASEADHSREVGLLFAENKFSTGTDARKMDYLNYQTTYIRNITKNKSKSRKCSIYCTNLTIYFDFSYTILIVFPVQRPRLGKAKCDLY